MSISFESAVETLKAMFPEWDPETLSTLLESNNYHVERTIETVLALSGDAAMQEEPTPAPPPTTRGVVTKVDGHDVNLLGLEGLDDRKIDGKPIVSPMKSQFLEIDSKPPVDSKYRGTRCVLPDEFLRVSERWQNIYPQNM